MATYRKSPETGEQIERPPPSERGEWMVDVATHRVFRMHRLPERADEEGDAPNEGGVK